MTPVMLGLFTLGSCLCLAYTIDQKGDLEEVICQSKYFRASCPHDNEILVVSKARYGRMDISRCVKENFGYIGCSADVLDVLDWVCSGKRTCSLRVLDENFHNMKPCHEDLKSYLMVEYRCVKVITPPEGLSCSQTSTPLPITHSHGILASITTLDTGCGSSNSPWVIRVFAGQRVNISLMDFGAMSSRHSPQHSQGGLSEISAPKTLSRDLVTGQAEDVGPPKNCRVYTLIKDPGSRSLVTVCSGDTRWRHVFLSQTNSVEVMIVIGSSPTKSPAFLLSYTAVGCRDYVAPPDVKVQRSDDLVFLGCAHSSQTWHLLCKDMQWVGQMQNCSTIDQLGQDKTDDSQHDSTITESSGLLILIIMAMTLAIALFVLILGSSCLNRLHKVRTRWSHCGPPHCFADSSDYSKSPRVTARCHDVISNCADVTNGCSPSSAILSYDITVSPKSTALISSNTSASTYCCWRPEESSNNNFQVNKGDLSIRNSKPVKVQNVSKESNFQQSKNRKERLRFQCFRSSKGKKFEKEHVPNFRRCSHSSVESSRNVIMHTNHNVCERNGLICQHDMGNLCWRDSYYRSFDENLENVCEVFVDVRDDLFEIIAIVDGDNMIIDDNVSNIMINDNSNDNICNDNDDIMNSDDLERDSPVYQSEKTLWQHDTNVCEKTDAVILSSELKSKHQCELSGKNSCLQNVPCIESKISNATRSYKKKEWTEDHFDSADDDDDDDDDANSDHNPVLWKVKKTDYKSDENQFTKQIEEPLNCQTVQDATVIVSPVTPYARVHRSTAQKNSTNFLANKSTIANNLGVKSSLQSYAQMNTGNKYDSSKNNSTRNEDLKSEFTVQEASDSLKGTDASFNIHQSPEEIFRIPVYNKNSPKLKNCSINPIPVQQACEFEEALFRCHNNVKNSQQLATACESLESINGDFCDNSRDPKPSGETSSETSHIREYGNLDEIEQGNSQLCEPRSCQVVESIWKASSNKKIKIRTKFNFEEPENVQFDESLQEKFVVTKLTNFDNKSTANTDILENLDAQESINLVPVLNTNMETFEKSESLKFILKYGDLEESLICANRLDDDDDFRNGNTESQKSPLILVLPDSAHNIL